MGSKDVAVIASGDINENDKLATDMEGDDGNGDDVMSPRLSCTESSTFKNPNSGDVVA